MRTVIQWNNNYCYDNENNNNHQHHDHHTTPTTTTTTTATIEHDHDTESINNTDNNNCKCILGINQKNGRLQWCPDCEYLKIAVLIPFIMFAILIAFFLITKLDTSLQQQQQQQHHHHHQQQHNHNQQNQQQQQQQQRNFRFISNSANIIATTNNNNIGNNRISNGKSSLLSHLPTATGTTINRKCIPIKYGLSDSETIDYDETHILKDFRTSFIPPDMIIVPSKCNDYENDDDDDNDDNDNDDNDNNNKNNDINRDGINNFNVDDFHENINYDDDHDDSHKNDKHDHDYDYGKKTLLSRSRRKLPNNNDGNGDGNEQSNFELSSSYTINTLKRTDIVTDINSNLPAEFLVQVSLEFLWNNKQSPDNIRRIQAEIMKKYMDTNVDPCVDFYQFACGNWNKLNPIPKDKAGYDTFEILREQLDKVLKDLLTSERNDNVDSNGGRGGGGGGDCTTNDTTEKPKSFDGVNVENFDTLKDELRKKIVRKRQVLVQILRKYKSQKDDSGGGGDDGDLTNDTTEKPKNITDRENIENFDTLKDEIKLRKNIIRKRHVLVDMLRKRKLQQEFLQRRRRKRSTKYSSAPGVFEVLKMGKMKYTDDDSQEQNGHNQQQLQDPSDVDIDKVTTENPISTTAAAANNTTSSDNVDAETKAKYLYQSCINEKLLQQRGIKPLLDLLDSFGGWPVLKSNEWNQNNFDWLNLTGQLRLYNNDILIVEWIGPDIKNSDENIIQLDQTSLGLPTREYFLQETNSKYLNAYKIFMENIMNLLGATKEQSTATAKELIDFETELARITSSSDERANISMLYNRMTIDNLYNEVNGIDWNKYLSIVQQRDVYKNETIVIYAIDYMKKLIILINSTEPKTISNYLLWRFVRHRINNLDNRFDESRQKFFNALFGREESPPRWKTCIGQVNSNMGMAVGAMFVQKYFDDISKDDTLKMTHELQDAFIEILNKTNWLDSNTKYLAELKVRTMSLKIGYPDFILDKVKLNEKYSGLHVEPDKYFENTLNVLRFVADNEQLRLGKIINKTNWEAAPAIVNAYYSRNKNQIMFPAGILQPPFYHRHFPKSLNYGGIGVVIGHELTHGFDDKGRLFDKNGNLQKWWSDYSINGFHDRAKCLISQYGNYTVTEVGVQIDGESTQGENIADNGGIRQAFQAYENWLKRNENQNLNNNNNNNGKTLMEMEMLPGLNMTNKQLFFLNFAQIWCGTMRPEATRNKLKTAVHSPGKFRVIGTLSNSNEFAKEFNCPSGTPMNPTNKCSVW